MKIHLRLGPAAACLAGLILFTAALTHAAALGTAAGAGARVVVLPCCHDTDTCDVGALGGWMDASLAIDVRRAARLEQRGYRVWTHTIPAAITVKNRLLLGQPVASRERPQIFPEP